MQALFRRWPKLEMAVADSQIRWRERPGLRAIASLLCWCALATHSYDHHLVYLRGWQNCCMLILPFSVFGALTLCRCADKNANFLRQAVNFASRNGRSENPSSKDRLLKDELF